MYLTEKQLEEVAEYAKLQFAPAQIATILMVNEYEFLAAVNQTGNAAATAYQKGILLAEAELRKSIYQLAVQGSSPAQKQFLDLIKKRELQTRKKK